MRKILSFVLALVMILLIGMLAVSAYESSGDYVWILTSRLGAKVENYLYFPVYYDEDRYFYGGEDTKIKITFPFTYDPGILKPIEVTPSELLYGMNFKSEISRVDVYTYIDEYGVEITYPYFYADITFDGDTKINNGEVLFNVKMEIIGETTSNSGGLIFDSFFLVEDLEQEQMTCCKWEVIDVTGKVVRDMSSKIQHNYRLDIDDTEDNLTLNNYVPFIPPVSDISEVTYVQSENTRKNFTVTANGRQSMIQFIEPDGGTRTYDRYNKNVSITSYDADDNEVSAMSRDLAYEVWEIYSNMSVGNEIKVRGKENGVWDNAKYSFTIEPYNPVVSMELSSTSGNKGAVPATVVADEKTEKVMFKMPNGTSTTVASTATDENGNKIFNGKAWMNEDGINEIKVYIRRDNVWKLVGTLEYTAE